MNTGVYAESAVISVTNTSKWGAKLSRQDVRGIPDYCKTTKGEALDGAVLYATFPWILSLACAAFGFVMRWDAFMVNLMALASMTLFLLGVGVAIYTYWDGGIGGRWFCRRNRIVYPDA